MTDSNERSRSPLPWALIAAILFAITLLVRWPGVAMYDSVTQYEQALSGDYGDWHPPIMARAWALLNLIHPGTEPFFVIQMLLWWGGIGLLAAALGRRARHGAAALTLLVGICPLFLGWATVVLKDAQMACCLVAATGIAAQWRIEGRALPKWADAVIGVLIAYATLVRGNAAFGTIPFALALWGWGSIGRPALRIGATLAAIAVAIGFSGPINHGLLGAERSHVERTLPLYDLAGVAHFAPLDTLPGLPAASWRKAEVHGCYTPYYWNPYGEPDRCGFVGDALAFDDAQGPVMMRRWLKTVATHPLAYAEHRIAHLNSNLRFWVKAGEGDAIPPVSSEINQYALGGRPTPAGEALIGAAGMLAASPIGWPILWLVLAIGLLWASARAPAGTQAALGRALALSAACMSASFAVVSIASDLRYHLWSMVASALALLLLWDAGSIERRRGMIAGGVLIACAVVASAGHIGLAPASYQTPPFGATAQR